MKAIAIFDIDGVLRDVGGSYRRALADTVEHYTQGGYRPSQADIDALKSEGLWNNDWEASREFIYRHFEQQGQVRSQVEIDFDALVDFFQVKYRGKDPVNPDRWDGYISQEPLLVQSSYFANLTEDQIAWGFFSGATRGSAFYVLERRLGLQDPVVVAMEDSPGKPDPQGLETVIERLSTQYSLSDVVPVIYAGDTVADMQTVQFAAKRYPERPWLAVGIIPPHALTPTEYRDAYASKLINSGAAVVLDNIECMDAAKIMQLVATNVDE